MTQRSVNIAGQVCAVLPQTLNWDELNTKQRMEIIYASFPSCFRGSRQILANQSWAEIDVQVQRVLSTVSWDRVISGVLQ